MEKLKKSRDIQIILIMILVACIAAARLNRLVAGIYCLAAGVTILFFTWVVPRFEIKKRYVKELLLLINACIGYMILEMATGNLFQISLSASLINILFVYVFEKLVETIFSNLTFTRILTLVVCLIIGIAEYYVVQFRGTPVTPWDLMVLDTAATVFAQYEFHYTKEIYLPVMLLIAAIAFVFKFHCHNDSRALKLRVQNVLITLAGIMVLNFGIYPQLEATVWDMLSVYRTQGTVASFIANLSFLQTEKPEGYTVERVEEILSETAPVAAISDVQAHNVIVVMVEALADFRTINDELVSDEYMPFWDSLTENVLKGYTSVPVFGNGTCDSEFEMLTGISTRYTGAYPYVLKVTSPVETMASNLLSIGYDTLAYHPYDKVNWNRPWVYSCFGFRNYYGLEDTPVNEQENMRWMMSDSSNYKKIISFNEAATSERFFAFNVTMQNHGGYDGEWDGFTKTVDLSEQGSFAEAENYLTLVQMSDDAIKELITYYENVDEPTLICFFGDHQPAVEDSYYEYLFGKSLNEMTQEERLQRYVTPCMIWANYDLPESNFGEMSVNYLAPLIMQCAGYDLDGFYSFLSQLREEYPILSRNGIMAADGHLLTEEEEANSQLLKDYEMLCYYLMQGGTVN